jgi:hypothetical protein
MTNDIQGQVRQRQAGGKWWQVEPACDPALVPTPGEGDPCPACQSGRLAYDSLFVLACPLCGRAVSGGGFT